MKPLKTSTKNTSIKSQKKQLKLTVKRKDPALFETRRYRHSLWYFVSSDMLHFLNSFLGHYKILLSFQEVELPCLCSLCPPAVCVCVWDRWADISCCGSVYPLREEPWPWLDPHLFISADGEILAKTPPSHLRSLQPLRHGHDWDYRPELYQ